ncbi:MAG: hypothetical protein KBT87_03565 [Gammaproteobacteria bacterium]|jgi:hypothetical protein|nr:hypothetical protein [Gammaproteobacteria bacterium]MBQ0773732.1 hypothetical protein [Gammaproteobacteria bacterium]
MSRMVRENQVSGLRERQWFAQVLLRQLQQRQQDGAAHGELLALRGAVLFHLYSALVGLARNAGSNYAVTDIEQLLSLPSITRAFAQQQVQSPEINLIEAARTNTADVIHWLEQQVMAANAASGLARRPLPPQEEGMLAMVADDPNAVLASGDIERLHSAVARVKEVLEAAAAHMEEW